MRANYAPSQLAAAKASLIYNLPAPVRVTDEDMTKVGIPGWKYDEIEDEVLCLYEDVDARIMPLSVFDIIHTLGHVPIQYRLFGPHVLTECVAT